MNANPTRIARFKVRAIWDCGKVMLYDGITCEGVEIFEGLKEAGRLKALAVVPQFMLKPAPRTLLDKIAALKVGEEIIINVKPGVRIETDRANVVAAMKKRGVEIRTKRLSTTQYAVAKKATFND
jgi:hypothetical protein